MQKQDIEILNTVRRHDMPLEWRSDVLELSFPDDGEIMEIVFRICVLVPGSAHNFWMP